MVVQKLECIEIEITTGECGDKKEPLQAFLPGLHSLGRQKGTNGIVI